ncbi:MAG: MBOAT family protein [Lachnospiraceae bacterium]|nr:MBOAT family protein [Lachnospiraceae bacterium]
MIFSLVINYIIALMIEKNRKAYLLLIAIIYNFGILFVFKYFDFFIDVLGVVRGKSDIAKLNLILPIGISFYTFQLVSYVIDVYNKKIEAEKNFVDFGTYAIMFPQLIAGPIVRFTDIIKEVKSNRDINIRQITDGFSVFVFGLTSKVFLANQLSMIAVDAKNYGVENLSILGTWLLGVGYTFQMYFDFFGYSLMAIGLGIMTGFTIPKNFDNPYLSRSVEEYWRRWHITLNTWFRDYLLYPLLFSNLFRKIYNIFSKKTNRKIATILINIPATFLVWFASGLWHGANYNFVIWGIYFFLFLTLEQIFLSQFLKSHKIISHIYLVIVVIISFIIFFTEDLDTLKICLKNLFVYDGVLFSDAFKTMITSNYKVLIIAVLTVLLVPQKIYEKVKTNDYIKGVIVITLLAIDIVFIYIGYNDPFLYFRF